ncbi:DUF4419 domain-containing protein [Puteibacter caeruleilacunae]|nr:DUF4419 domain-containing protein [Puteibacter caeruleilacunae]
MRLLLLITVLLGTTVNVFAQHEVKFEVEKLSKPQGLIVTKDYNDLYKELILSDAKIRPSRFEEVKDTFPFNIIAKSETPDRLIGYGYHSFFDGMYKAYASHRPFVISPDMIWLLISQGFAQHVNANSASLRDKFVNFDGKLTLMVKAKSDMLNGATVSKDWEAVFAQFTTQMSEHLGTDLINTLSSDFSTTTSIEKAVSEITIMEAMKPFFEFVVFRVACGIPEITLKGTTEDWLKVYNKARKLGKYDLKWWTKELEPILKEFIRTSKGHIDKKFWRNMFKIHTEKVYGSPKIIDGWIVKFFPYSKSGKRNNLSRLVKGDNLPKEIVKVDLKYIEDFNGSTKTIPLELWAGFIGLEQNKDDFSLTPKIGWMIRKKDVDYSDPKKQFKEYLEFGTSIRVKEIPDAIFELEEIQSLNIEFIDRILIPEKLKSIKIERLCLSGKINRKEIERISKMFRNTELFINNKLIEKL